MGHLVTSGRRRWGGRINNKSILQQLQPNSTALTGSLAYTLAEVFQLPWPDSEGCVFAGRLKKQQQQNFINPQTAMSLIIHPLVRTLPSIGPKAAKRFMGRKFTFLRKKKKASPEPRRCSGNSQPLSSV